MSDDQVQAPNATGSGANRGVREVEEELLQVRQRVHRSACEIVYHDLDRALFEDTPSPEVAIMIERIVGDLSEEDLTIVHAAADYIRQTAKSRCSICYGRGVVLVNGVPETCSCASRSV